MIVNVPRTSSSVYPPERVAPSDITTREDAIPGVAILRLFNWKNLLVPFTWSPNTDRRRFSCRTDFDGGESRSSISDLSCERVSAWLGILSSPYRIPKNVSTIFDALDPNVNAMTLKR